MSYRRTLAITLILASFTALGSSAHAQLSAPDPNTQFSLNAAGATFPFPLIDLWRVEYAKAYPNVSLNYQSIGSGGGIQQHIERTVNFAASDAPMTRAEAALAPGTYHIPETIGGIAVAYNIPEISESGLQLDGETIAQIYLGEITMWNDERIAAHNPGVDLPEAEIIPAHRSDGSGTTFVFTDYLTTVYGGFDEAVGKGKSVPWPGGVAAAGNEGVSRIVLSTPYSIGYVELAYAFQTGMSVAHVRNGDDTAYIAPTVATIMAAAEGASSDLPLAAESWERVTMVNAPGATSYPISSFTYLLLYSDLGGVADSEAEAGAIVHAIHWMLTEGQSHSESLLYVPLPKSVADVGISGLQFVTYNGFSVWSAQAADPFAEEMTGSDTMMGSEGMTDMTDGAMAETGENAGCLIATAAYGSELAPQVQALREVRDNVLMSTASGAAFMGAFNNVYYTFSPAVADLESQSPELRGAVRALITPMIASLSILSYAEAGSESDVLGLGMLVIGLNVGMYVAAPAALATWSWRRRPAARC